MSAALELVEVKLLVRSLRLLEKPETLAGGEDGPWRRLPLRVEGGFIAADERLRNSGSTSTSLSPGQGSPVKVRGTGRERGGPRIALGVDGGVGEESGDIVEGVDAGWVWRGDTKGGARL